MPRRSQLEVIAEVFRRQLTLVEVIFTRGRRWRHRSGWTRCIRSSYAAGLPLPDLVQEPSDGEEGRAMRRLEVVVDGPGGVLAGDVRRPDDAVAGMLMHPGSGPSDRSNDGLFEPLADHLLAHRIAIAWFDKRGVGGSGGALADAGIVEQAADLCAALDAVRSENGPLPIGVFGHSQGGWVVVEAAQTGSPAFVISQSGPAVSPNTQEAFSTGNRLRRAGWDEQHITRAVDLVRVALHRAAEGAPWDDQVEWYAERRDAVDELIEIGAFVAADPELWRLIARMGAYDPVDALRNVRVPLLAIFGAADQVVPVDESVRILERTVDPALLELMIVPDADHRIEVRNLRPAATLEGMVEFILRVTTAETH